MRHPETRDLQTLAASHAGAGQLASSRPARLPPGGSRSGVAALTRRELVHEPSRARFDLKAVAPGVQAVPALVRAGPLGSLARAVIGVLTLGARPSSCSGGSGASAAAAPRRLHGSGSTRPPPRRESWSDKAMLLNALVPEDAANVIAANVIIKSRAEPSRAEPSRAEPSRAEPSRAEPSRAEPSRAEPSRAEPSRAEPSRAEPSRAEPSRAEPSRAEPSRAEPSRAEPSRAEPSRAEPSRAEPSRAEPRPLFMSAGARQSSAEPIPVALAA